MGERVLGSAGLGGPEVIEAGFWTGHSGLLKEEREANLTYHVHSIPIAGHDGKEYVR